MAYSVELFCGDQDEPAGADVTDPLPSVDSAIDKVKSIAATNLFSWGESTQYRIKDEGGNVVQEGSLYTGSLDQ